MTTLLAAASIAGASWPLIFMMVSLILLFIAAFITDSVGSGNPVRIHFGWSGAFFAVLAVALS